MKGGSSKGFNTTIGLLIAGLVVVVSLAIWALIGYLSEKSDVDSRIQAAVAEARKDQADIEEAKFLERENQPYRDFAGPENYGSLNFKYPKTWSVYVARNAGSGGNYEAYLHPVVVPTIASNERFALRVVIEDREYDRVVSGYDSAVSRGDLKSSSVKANGATGVRLDGNFSRDIRGSAVIFKIRDKTLTLRTDLPNFEDEFGKIIATISFNQ